MSSGQSYMLHDDFVRAHDWPFKVIAWLTFMLNLGWHVSDAWCIFMLFLGWLGKKRNALFIPLQKRSVVVMFLRYYTHQLPTYDYRPSLRLQHQELYTSLVSHLCDNWVFKWMFYWYTKKPVTKFKLLWLQGKQGLCGCIICAQAVFGAMCDWWIVEGGPKPSSWPLAS